MATLNASMPLMAKYLGVFDDEYHGIIKVLHKAIIFENGVAVLLAVTPLLLSRYFTSLEKDVQIIAFLLVTINTSNYY